MKLWLWSQILYWAECIYIIPYLGYEMVLAILFKSQMNYLYFVVSSRESTSRMHFVSNNIDK